nr:hypothetical protein [Thiomonas sp. FB-Cd]
MTTNRMVSIMAGFMVLLSLMLAQITGQIDLLHPHLAVAHGLRRPERVPDGFHRLLSRGQGVQGTGLQGRHQCQ